MEKYMKFRLDVKRDKHRLTTECPDCGLKTIIENGVSYFDEIITVSGHKFSISTTHAKSQDEGFINFKKAFPNAKRVELIEVENKE